MPRTGIPDNLKDIEIAPGVALARDIRRFLSKRSITGDQARYLTASYLALQSFRVAMSSSAKANREAGTESLTLELFAETLHELEEAMVPILGRWARSMPHGRWMLSLRGIGPVIAAGICSYATPDICDRPHRLWAYAGLTPDRRNNFSRHFRRFAYYAGESFIRTGGYYRSLYLQRKAYEWRKNIAGEYADQARAKLDRRLSDGARAFLSGEVCPERLLGAIAAHRTLIAANGALNPAIRRSTCAPVPMLTPGHIDRRARRWTVKLFLSHYSEVAWESTRRPSDPPWQGPYAITVLGHRDRIAPPNWPVSRAWDELAEPVPELYPELALHALIDALSGQTKP